MTILDSATVMVHVKLNLINGKEYAKNNIFVQIAIKHKSPA